jgi:hypothetical protein
VARRLKRIALVLVALVAVIAGCLGGLYYFGSDQTREGFAFALAAILANHDPPQIARSGVVSTGKDWMDTEPTSAKFTAVLHKNFPSGSDEQAMRGALVSQGFKPQQVTDCGLANGPAVPAGADRSCRTSALDRALEYDWGGFPCNSELAVRWVADRKGHIVKIEGFYRAGCL